MNHVECEHLNDNFFFTSTDLHLNQIKVFLFSIRTFRTMFYDILEEGKKQF